MESDATKRRGIRRLLWEIYMVKPVRTASLFSLRRGLSVGRKLGLLYRRPIESGQPNPRYSIGVVTYIRRYRKFFRPLIETLCQLFPDTEIIVAVNGYYDPVQQAGYLRRISAFLAQFPNVRPLLHHEPQSLARLWNQLIINARGEKLFIFNDDILVLPSFREELERSGVLANEIGLLKRSWSHFLISKAIIARVGWFDERLPGVGNEDEDFEARLTLQGMAVPSVPLNALLNIVFKTKDFSYGKKMPVINGKYTSANKRFFDAKWEIIESARAGFVYVPILGKWARMRIGMETPNFYPEIEYSAS
jgi:hypothetical protein